MITEALTIALIAMNTSTDQINSFLSSNLFTQTDFLSTHAIIKEMMRNVVELRLLGDFPTVYQLLDQALYVDNSSRVLEAAGELVTWYNSTQESGMSLALGTLTRLYSMVSSVLPPASQVCGSLPCDSNVGMRIASNLLSLIELLGNSSSLLAPIQDILKPIQTQVYAGQNLNDLLTSTRTSRAATNLPREPIDDFLDLLTVNYQGLFQAMSAPLSPEETLDTMYMLFSNPDLRIFLKGWTKELTNSSAADGTIDATLAMLSAITHPNQDLGTQKNLSSQILAVLQSVNSRVNKSMSSTDPMSYWGAVDQTLKELSSILPPQETQYMNVSAHMMVAFFSLMFNPMDPEIMKTSIQDIAGSLSRTLAFSGKSTLPDGRSIEDVAFMMLLSSAVASEILFNISSGNTSDINSLLAQSFQEMAPVIPPGSEELLTSLPSALTLALSGFSHSSQISPAFLNISQNITESMLAYLNLNEDAVTMGTSTPMPMKNLTQLLFTVSTQVFSSVFESLSAGPVNFRVPFVLGLMEEVTTSMGLVLPPRAQQYSNASFRLLQTVALALNLTGETQDLRTNVGQLSDSIQNLMGTVIKFTYNVSTFK